MSSPMTQNIVLAVTGASGTAYALRLAQILTRSEIHVHLVISEAARMVSLREVGTDLPPDSASGEVWQTFIDQAFHQPPASEWGFRQLTQPVTGQISVHEKRDYSAGIASGSFLTRGMVICPCSMGTLSSIAGGASTNLIQRAADVHLKERRTLILVPRETPLSSIALENMTRLSQAGALVLPSMPGFYHQPQCLADLVDFVVARICDQLQVPHDLMERWGE